MVPALLGKLYIPDYAEALLVKVWFLRELCQALQYTGRVGVRAVLLDLLLAHPHEGEVDLVSGVFSVQEILRTFPCFVSLFPFSPFFLFPFP